MEGLKKEPFFGVLEAHHAHLNSSVEVGCHFMFQLVGLASKDVDLLITENDAQLTFKAPCQVAIECGLAMDFLF